MIKYSNILILLLCANSIFAQMLPNDNYEASISSNSANGGVLNPGKISRSGFVENKGQFMDQNNLPNTEVKYLCTLPGLQVQIRENGYSYEVKKELERVAETNSGRKKDRGQLEKITYGIHRVDIVFDGAYSNTEWEAFDQQEGHTNYYTAGTSESGILNVRTFNRLVARNVWDNIDVEFLVSEESEHPFKYNIIVHPGGDPASIRLHIEGMNGAGISESGGLIINTQYGDLEETIPFSYIEGSGENIGVRFHKIEGNVFGIQLPEGFSTFGKKLIIDPTPDRVWGTYYGGTGDDYGRACKTDNNGNVYMAGETASSNNIATSGAHQTVFSGSENAYLVKFNSNGVRQWGTFYGAASTFAWAIAVDGNANIFLAGNTISSSNISTSGSHQPIIGGQYDAFLVRFNSSGVRQWATYYGGASDDDIGACDVDASSNVYLFGSTSSSSGISTAGAHQVTYGGNYDGFVAKFNSNGVRQWGTYYGGNNNDTGLGGAADISGNILLAGGSSSSSGISTSGSHQTVLAGGSDGFLVKFNSNGVRQWGTFYGGSADDVMISCDTDGAGNIYTTGQSSSSSGIATAGAHQPANAGGDDGFMAKFNSSGARQWGSYYGGSGDEECNHISSDASGNIYISGYTIFSSTGIATLNSFQPAIGGFQNAFLVKLNSSGTRQWGTYYGGDGFAFGFSCDYDPSGYIYLCGVSDLGTNIATTGAHQFTSGGGNDAFLVKFSQASCAVTATISNTTPACSGQNNGSATVIATGGTSYTYLWSNGQTTSTVSNLAAGAYTVTVTSNTGCTATATASIANNPATTAGFTFINNGLQAVFTNTSANGTTYSWNFGDGQTSIQASPSHIYSSTGNYNVCLTATGICGSTPYCQTITIVPVAPPDMVPVQGGTFTMGCTGEQTGCYGSESPTHEVTLSDFEIGKYEVTQGQWMALMSDINPSGTPSFTVCGDSCPIERVSWYDAVVFCNRLSEQLGYTPCYYSDAGYSQLYGKSGSVWSLPNTGTIYWKQDANGYRLPTEAEWEYAARGGSVATVQTLYSGSNDVNAVAWYFGNSGSTTHPVGGKQANALGLYDMSGNVYEWCYDWYGSSYYANSPGCTPVGESSGSNRVGRGGSWSSGAVSSRVAHRNYGTPGNRNNYIGFRLSRTP